MEENLGKKILGLHVGEKKVILRFEDEKISIHPYTYVELKLYVGKILTPKDFKDIKYLDELDIYLTYAKKLLSKSNRSEQYLLDKLLTKGASKKQANAVIKSLKEARLLNDDYLLEELLDVYEYKCYGKHKIIESLKQKGISSNKIEKLYFNESSELKKAKSLLPSLEKKFAKYNTSKKKEHIYSYLIRYGFDGDVARSVSNLAKANKQSDELESLRKEYLSVSKRYMRKYSYKDVDKKVDEYLLRKGYRYQDIKVVKGEK